MEGAQLLAPDHRKVIGCTIRDLSAGVPASKSSNGRKSHSFLGLSFDCFCSFQRCELKWRSKTRIGVAFRQSAAYPTHSCHCLALEWRCSPPTFRSCAVVLPSSRNVLMCLKCAGQARERAQQATNETDCKFQQELERLWMNLSAITAFAERADLFLHSLHSGPVPLDTCRDCRKLMRIETVEATCHQEFYTFRCHHCDSVEQRIVVKTAGRAVDMRLEPSGSSQGRVRQAAARRPHRPFVA